MSYYEQSGIITKNIVTHRNLSELIVTHSTNLSKHHDRISCEKAQLNRLLWVTISYYEQSGIITKNIVTHRNLSELIGTYKTNHSKHHDRISCEKGSDATPLAPRPNFLSEGVRLGLDKEIAPDGTYLAYFPFGAMIERSRMTPYHKKLKWEVIRIIILRNKRSL